MGLNVLLKHLKSDPIPDHAGSGSCTLIHIHMARQSSPSVLSWEALPHILTVQVGARQQKEVVENVLLGLVSDRSLPLELKGTGSIGAFRGVRQRTENQNTDRHECHVSSVLLVEVATE